MKKSIIILSLLTSIIISNNSYGINCADPAVYMGSSCTPQPTQLTLNPVLYSEVTTLSPNPCCLKNCVSNANFNGTNCVCNDTYYYDSASNTCESCPACTVINGSATVYTANNHCAYNIQCLPGYEVTFDRCSDSQAATCKGATYIIELDNQANGGSTGNTAIREIYGTEYLDSSNTPITQVPFPEKSSYKFTGYYSGGNEIVIPATGILPANTNFTSNTTLYAYYEACPTIARTNGTVYQLVSNNTCGDGGYYIVCNAGFQNTSNYDESHPSASSSLSCSTCSAGYYCPGGTRQQCPSHTTSYAGADESTDCHAAPGYYKQTPTSSVTPCTGGMTSNEAATSLTNCYYEGGASGTKFCDSNGCLHLPINIVY